MVSAKVSDHAGDLEMALPGEALPPSPSKALGEAKDADYELAGSHDSDPLTPNDIAWSGVGFSVGDKTILSDCWGKVPSGSVCAIMGPSGAGKSSLLNLLAGRVGSSLTNRVTGHVSVGQKEINPVAFRKNIAYVMQDDHLMATATPREALRFSAALRLPGHLTAAQLDAVVDHTIARLGLESCADVLIGGALIKGISGGQRKRTSVGVEVITNPRLLFLDEPTSGLDSVAAFSCVTLLRSLATQSSCAVVCTIHQPSSEVLFLFDSLILMKDGRVMYSGPVPQLTAHFSKFGYVCPENYNPADYVMMLAQTESLQTLEEKGLMLPTPASSSAIASSSTASIGSVTLALQQTSLAGADGSSGNNNAKAASDTSEAQGLEVKASFLQQMAQLVYREGLNIRRDTNALIARFGVIILLSFLVGLIFLGVGNGNSADPAAFNSHFGGVMLMLIFSMFGTANPVMMNFPYERPLFLREYTTGTYSAAAYFISKVIWEIPLVLLQVVVQYLLGYFMLGLKGSFLYIVLACWGLGMASDSVAVVLGCSVSDVKKVTELAPLLFVPQMLFAGFFVSTNQIPVFLRWAQWLCSLKYAMNLVLLTEFGPASSSCQGAEAAQNCSEVLTSNDIQAHMSYVYILVLVALFVGFRVLAAGILVKKAKTFY